MGSRVGDRAPLYSPSHRAAGNGLGAPGMLDKGRSRHGVAGVGLRPRRIAHSPRDASFLMFVVPTSRDAEPAWAAKGVSQRGRGERCAGKGEG